MLVAWIAAVAGVCSLAAAQNGSIGARYEANWESLDKRPFPSWFNEARFGIFFCWGPYCVPGWAPRGTYAEWYGYSVPWERYPQPGNDSLTYQFHERVYGKDFKYEQFGPMMKAEMFDPDFWADLCARSGAKYVILSAKYHDGFSMWPDPYAPGWNCMDVGPKRDVLGELTQAVRKRGLRMGIYFSLYEWFHPLWLSDRKRYVDEHYIPQFKDVVTKYKPCLIFADGEWEADYKLWRSEEVLAWLFNESPVKDEVVVNDRWGNCRGSHGSFYESEYGGGNMPPTHPWQEDRGMGASYGYNRNESIFEYGSAASMIRMLAKCAGNGGNLLIDVGPTADGRIPVIMQERLLQIGDWLKVNGESIYGTKASPFWPKQLAWGTCTAKPGKLFFHIYDRPGDSIALPLIKNKIGAAYFLADPARKPVKVKRTREAIKVVLPERLPDQADSVLVLEIQGEPEVERVILRQQADGAVVLGAGSADIHGPTPRLEYQTPRGNIGYWGDPNDSVSWEFEIRKPGEFEVELSYSCDDPAAGSEFTVSVGGQAVEGRTKPTGGWNRFARESLGRIRLGKPGRYTLTVQPKSEPKWQAMGLESVTLRPMR